MILITGDKGYIGSHLTQFFDASIGCDLKDGKDYRDIQGQEFDVVIHLAASVSVVDSFITPDLYMENNCYGIKQFLSRNRVDKFVFVSTGGAMYGNSHAAKEEDASLDKCISPYAKSKFIAEQFIRANVKKHTILRLANVYGGDLSIRGEAAVHAHFEQDNPIVLYDGDQTRDFVHIDTVCEAIRRAATRDIRGTFNIGSGRETRISDIAEVESERRNVTIRRLPTRTGEVHFIALNCSKAKQAGLL